MRQQLLARLNSALELLDKPVLNFELYKGELLPVLKEVKGGSKQWLVRTLQTAESLKGDPAAFRENQKHNLMVMQKLLTGKAFVPEVARGVSVQTFKNLRAS